MNLPFYTKGFDVNRSLLFLRIFFCFCEYDGSLSDERKFKEGLSICPDYFIGDFKQNLKVKYYWVTKSIFLSLHGR